MKIIYQPRGAAGEYAKYAVNFVVGCEYGCKYCYNRRGMASGYLGGDPKFVQGKNDENFFELVKEFEQDVVANKEELQKHGVFMSFTSDPLMEGWTQPAYFAMQVCDCHNVPVTILTKNGLVTDLSHIMSVFKTLANKGLLNFGVTLTGYNDLEGVAPTNAQRMEALKAVKELGAKTWVSLEPVIDCDSSYFMLTSVISYIDEVRIGLLTPVSNKRYPLPDLEDFRNKVNSTCLAFNVDVHWKRSFIETLEKLRNNK